MICINSHQHILEGEVLVDVTDPGHPTVDCPMCGNTVGLLICVHTGEVGFHYIEHDESKIEPGQSDASARLGRVS